MVETVYTIQEVADALKVKPEVVRDLLRDGKLKGFKAGKFWRVTEGELQRFMQPGQEGQKSD